MNLIQMIQKSFNVSCKQVEKSNKKFTFIVLSLVGVSRPGHTKDHKTGTNYLPALCACVRVGV